MFEQIIVGGIIVAGGIVIGSTMAGFIQNANDAAALAELTQVGDCTILENLLGHSVEDSLTQCVGDLNYHRQRGATASVWQSGESAIYRSNDTCFTVTFTDSDLYGLKYTIGEC